MKVGGRRVTTAPLRDVQAALRVSFSVLTHRTPGPQGPGLRSRALEHSSGAGLPFTPTHRPTLPCVGRGAWETFQGSLN